MAERWKGLQARKNSALPSPSAIDLAPAAQIAATAPTQGQNASQPAAVMASPASGKATKLTRRMP